MGAGPGLGPAGGMLPGNGASSRIDFHSASAAEVHCTRLWSCDQGSFGTVTNLTCDVFRPTALWATSRIAFVPSSLSRVSELVAAMRNRTSLSGLRRSLLLVASCTIAARNACSRLIRPRSEPSAPMFLPTRTKASA